MKYPDLPGGAAFPSAPEADVQKSFVNEGMSLRDYFAAAALIGVQSRVAMNVSVDDVADYAYLQADAMLEKRK